MRRLAVLVAALAAPLLVDPAARAQDASPVALPATPAPAACAIAPRPVAELEAALATPAPPVPTGFAPPPGEPADPATVAAVTATVVELVACSNAGDIPRAAALYTTAGFREDYGGHEVWRTLLLARLTPQPLAPSARTAVLAVRDVAVLDDGRVGAVVEIEYGVVSVTYPDETTDYLVFAAEGGRYRVDRWVDGYRAPGGTPPAGTPTP